MNSERRAVTKKGGKKTAPVEGDDSGIDPIARTVLDKGTTSEEAQYMLSQLVHLTCELQCTNSADKKSLKLAEEERTEVCPVWMCVVDRTNH